MFLIISEIYLFLFRTHVNLESELVYLPMKYTKGNYYPSGFPFGLQVEK